MLYIYPSIKIKMKNKTINTEFDSTSEFFIRHIEIANVLVPEIERLTRQEVIFLARYVEFIYNGGHIGDHKGLSEYLLTNRIIHTPNNASGYKTRLGIKRWLRKKDGVYDLPNFLRFKPGEELRTKITMNNGLIEQS